jgi:hypothetical protein
MTQHVYKIRATLHGLSVWYCGQDDMDRDQWDVDQYSSDVRTYAHQDTGNMIAMRLMELHRRRREHKALEIGVYLESDY